MAFAQQQPRRAWSLLELLLVLAILGILFGLVAMFIQTARESANRMTCQTHLKDLVLAVHSYHSAKGRMPPYASGRPGELYGGWYLHLLPYVGHDAVYRIVKDGQRTQVNGLSVATSGWELPGVHDTLFPELVCPSDLTRSQSADENLTSYLANWYAFADDTVGIYRPAQPFSQLTDGLGSVVLFAEGYSVCDKLQRRALYPSHWHNFGITAGGRASDDPYYAPNDYTMFQVQPTADQCDKYRAQTPHSVMHVAVAEGNVRSVSAHISPTTWKQALKPRDGAVLGSDWDW